MLKIIFKNRNTLRSNPGKPNISSPLCLAYFTSPPLLSALFHSLGSSFTVSRMQRSIHSGIKLILVRIYCAPKRLLGMRYICWSSKHFFTLKKIDTQTSNWSQERHRTVEDANIQQLCLKCVVFIAKYKCSRGCGNTQCLRVLAVPTEMLGSTPSKHMVGLKHL